MSFMKRQTLCLLSTNVQSGHWPKKGLFLLHLKGSPVACEQVWCSLLIYSRDIDSFLGLNKKQKFTFASDFF